MTIYSHPDDLGLAGTWYSLNWGSMGKPIACCNIRRYKWPFAVVNDVAVSEQKEEDSKGRGLEDEDDEVDDGEIDYFTLEEF